jgi:PRTRC genetic system protein E
MTMFDELYVLAAGASLTLTISADHKTGRMTINVIPRPNKDADEPALTQALSLTATPQEFDEGFVAALQGYREARQSLADQVEATKEVLEAAKLASVRKATEANTKARTDKPAAPSTTKPAVSAAQAASHAEPEHDEGEGDGGDEGDAAPTPAKAIGEPMDLFG